MPSVRTIGIEAEFGEELSTLVGATHNTVASLHMESWRNEMNAEINLINQTIPTIRNECMPLENGRRRDRAAAAGEECCPKGFNCRISLANTKSIAEAHGLNQIA